MNPKLKNMLNQAGTIKHLNSSKERGIAMGFWDSEKIIGIISKNNWSKEIQVKKVSKGTREYIDVRTFYEKDGELLPGKGISIPIDVAHEIGVLILNETEKESD